MRCTMLTFATIFKGAVDLQIVSPNFVQSDIFTLKQPLIRTICRPYNPRCHYALMLQCYIFLADVAYLPHLLRRADKLIKHYGMVLGPVEYTENMAGPVAKPALHGLTRRNSKDTKCSDWAL